MNHIRFGKDRTTPGDPYRDLCAQSQPAKFLKGDVQPFRLLIQEGTGAGRANRVHGKIHDRTFTDNYNLRVLTPDLEHRLDPGMNLQSRNAMGGDLILNQIGADYLANEFPPGTSHPRPQDLMVFKILPELVQAFLYRSYGFSLCPQVYFLHYGTFFVNNHQISADRPHVDTKIKPCGHLETPFLLPAGYWFFSTGNRLTAISFPIPINAGLPFSHTPAFASSFSLFSRSKSTNASNLVVTPAAPECSSRTRLRTGRLKRRLKSGRILWATSSGIQVKGRICTTPSTRFVPASTVSAMVSRP